MREGRPWGASSALGSREMPVGAGSGGETLFDIERDINGHTAEARRAARQTRSAPLVADLHRWLAERRTKLSPRRLMAKAEPRGYYEPLGQEESASLLFLKRKKQKDFLRLALGRPIRRNPYGEKFFGSFFQERTRLLRLSQGGSAAAGS